MEMSTKCIDYGFTMIDADGNILTDITEYNGNVSTILINDIRKMLNIPKEYVCGTRYHTPNLFDDFLREFDPNKDRWINWHGKVFVVVHGCDCSIPYFMEITNQVKALQSKIRYF